MTTEYRIAGIETPAWPNMFRRDPEECPRIETAHRRITTKLPAPQTLDLVKSYSDLIPNVNCSPPPVLWDRAEGYQVFDAAGNCWIDFSSTAVMTNTGHGHPAIRDAIAHHIEDGLLAQFSFASEIRMALAKRLLELAPPGFAKVYFWTTGSETIECAFRVAREWAMQQHREKYHILTHAGNYHGWTLGAHQLSGKSAAKPWLTRPDAAIHHIPFPAERSADTRTSNSDWQAFFEESIAGLESSGVPSDDVAAIFIETLQAWGALPLPVSYVQALRHWADEHNVLVIFDEIQTGFGRTGKWFGHEHYGVKADLLCIGKGLTSSLPLAAVLGPADVLDVLPPGEITTTHAAHPLSCAAALANLKVLEGENLIEEAARKGKVARAELLKLKKRFPRPIAEINGKGLLQAVHVRNPQSGQPNPKLAHDWTWSAVKHGVMLFFTTHPTIKICPPLVISDDALVEGIGALGDALESVL